VVCAYNLSSEATLGSPPRIRVALPPNPSSLADHGSFVRGQQFFVNDKSRNPARRGVNRGLHQHNRNGIENTSFHDYNFENHDTFI